MNNWTISGRIGAKGAVLRSTANGDPVAGFSVAVDQRKGKEKVTMWVDCSLWGKRGEALAQYLTKGTVVSVSGEAGVREHDGKAYQTMRVSELTLLGGGSGERQESRPARSESRQGAPVDVSDDDIPF